MAEPRPLSEIARDITRVWQKPYFGAVPYLQAMRQLTTCRDLYGCDSGSSIVNYFLANANTFRGDSARTLKAELRAHLSNAEVQ